MFISIGMALAGLVGKKVAAKSAKVIGIVALVVLLIAVLSVGKCAYDNSVIEKHEARQDAANARADRKADTAAADTRRSDDARLTAEETQLRELRDDPTSTATERRLARQRCIRLQQSARAAGRESPACGRSAVPGGT
jgi:hypothetical protein